VRNALRPEIDRLAESADKQPDMEDVEARARRHQSHQRLMAAVVGLTVGLGAILVGTSVLTGDKTSGLVDGEPQTQGSIGSIIPEGQWVVQSSSDGWIERRGGERLSFDDLWAQAVSRTGDEMLALSFIPVTVEGEAGTTGGVVVTRFDSMVAMNTSTGATRVLGTLPPIATFGEPATWSPDGSHVLVGYGEWPRPLIEGAGHPGQINVESFCVISAQSLSRSCPRDLGPVPVFAWSPDGDAVTFVRDGVVHEFDLSSGSVSTLVNLQEGALAEALGTSVGTSTAAIGDIAWSPSGRFLAMSVSSDQFSSVPVVVDATDGSFRLGESSPSNQAMAWSPAADILAYGSGPMNPAGQRNPERSLYLLAAVSGDVRVVREEELGQGFFPSDIDWSPSGRWFAVSDVPRAHETEIVVIDGTRLEVASRFQLDSPAELFNPLVDWGV
jgi:hypothetical protein